MKNFDHKHSYATKGLKIRYICGESLQVGTGIFAEKRSSVNDFEKKKNSFYHISIQYTFEETCHRVTDIYLRKPSM